LDQGTDTHSQSRAGRWRSDGAQYVQQVRGRLRSFRRGSKRYKQKIKPAPEDVLRSTVTPDSPPACSDTPVFTAAAAGALPEEQAAINDLLWSIREGGAGFVQDSKPSDIIRLYGENVNGYQLNEEILGKRTNGETQNGLSKINSSPKVQ
jgi:hypothetical protein